MPQIVAGTPGAGWRAVLSLRELPWLWYSDPLLSPPRQLLTFTLNWPLRCMTSTGGAVGVPDLSVANLTAVAFRTSDNGEVMHYAGQNGCRLTYFRGASVFPESSDTPGQQIATWLSGDHLRHIVVATGMDRTRFDAIASYLMLETRERVSESVMASLSEATRTARSCVG